jgi:HTH-like domain
VVAWSKRLQILIELPFFALFVLLLRPVLGKGQQIAAEARPPSKRALRDEELKVRIVRVHAANYGVYGPRKVWLALNREGIEVARCKVERLMKDLGLQGIRRGKKWKTTTADPAAARPADLVQRRFNPAHPNALWVADFTYSAQLPVMCSCVGGVRSSG